MSLDDKLAVALRDDPSRDDVDLAAAWPSVATRAGRLRRRRRAGAAASVAAVTILVAAVTITMQGTSRDLRFADSPPPGTEFVGSDPNSSDRSGEEVSPSPGFAYSLYPQPWGRAIVVNERTLDVYYMSGLKECFALRDVRVDLERDTIRITLIEGTITTACRLPGRYYQTRVELTEPIGSRRVVDGAPSRAR